MIAVAEKEHQRALLASDNLALLFVFALTLVVSVSAPAVLAPLQFSWRPPFVIALAAIWTMCLYSCRAYEFPIRPEKQARSVGQAICLFGGLLAVFTARVHPLALLAGEMTVLFAASLVFRQLIPDLLLAAFGRRGAIRVLIAGSGPVADRVEQVFRNRNGYELVRVAQLSVAERCAPEITPTDLAACFEAHKPHELVLVLNGESPDQLDSIVKACREQRVACQFVPQFEFVFPGTAHVIDNLPLVSPRAPRIAGLNLRCKQTIDFFVGCIVLVLVAPMMAVIWAAIRVDSDGPAIIVQQRIGYRGRLFNFYKFRTMHSNSADDIHRAYIKKWIDNRPATRDSVFKLVKDPRITRVGRVLRRYSLDELPQIFNVLKLDMSLVGPRPALPYEVEHYAEWHKERFEGPPGMTGLWQVGGRNRVGFDDMVRLDLEYLRNWSVSLDLKLLARTIPVVLHGTGH
jgi:exopolysaccharide biosynthesis polyprenyl glycosylphosphotransferase